MLRKVKEMEAVKANYKVHSCKLSTVAHCVLIMHATACAAKRNWSVWKRFCNAELAATTLDHFKERMMIADPVNVVFHSNNSKGILG